MAGVAGGLGDLRCIKAIKALLIPACSLPCFLDLCDGKDWSIGFTVIIFGVAASELEGMLFVRPRFLGVEMTTQRWV